MDLDQFFAFGPEVPFTAKRVFTDREEYIRAFQQRLTGHLAEEWPVEKLMDFQRPARNVMGLSGEGGIGKSTLIRHLAALAQSGEFDGLPDDCAVAVIDFADLSSQSFETVLLRVRAALGRLGKAWPAFDIALSAYWERNHPGESLVRFLGKSPPPTRCACQSRSRQASTACSWGSVPSRPPTGSSIWSAAPPGSRYKVVGSS